MTIDSDFDHGSWKFLPFELGDCEDLENYKPGRFRSVHPGNVYDARYRVGSPTYIIRSVVASHSSISSSRLFAVADRQFLVDVLGPDLPKLSRSIHSRLKPAPAREVSLQAAQALALLYSNRVCYGGKQIVVLGWISGVNLAVDFTVLFGTSRTPPTECPGIPAKYLAPEVAVGRPASSASDIRALGCAIFLIWSGDDLFFDYNTDSPADVPRQVVETLGKEGLPVVGGEGGEPFWSLEEAQSLEPNRSGKAVKAKDMEPKPALFDDDDDDDAALRKPYPATVGSIVWKPAAVCIDGSHFAAFPKISDPEALLLTDFPSKVFTHDPARRITAKELISHP
ncbi:kinase-like protein [Daldinia sp. FL1419]|nr:kinase-like protein [Daldinia sp. FL1419]